MKKIFSFMLIAAGLMVSAQSFAAKDYKFYLGVESGSKVEATVFEDYSFDVVLPAGATVDPASVTISLKMKNVASLGVTTERSAEKTITTGLESRSISLSSWLSNAYAFEGATVNVDIIDGETKSCAWDIAGWNEGVIAASTETEETRAAWKLFVSHFTASQQAAEDSYIKIAAGSYLVFGDEKMTFANDLEIFKGELKIKDLTDALEGATITSTGATGAATYKPSLFVAKGSILAVGQSVATIDADMEIRIDASANAGDDITGELSKLQNDVKGQSQLGGKVNMAILDVMNLINKTIGIVDAAEVVDVEVEFANQWKVIRGEKSVIVADNDHALEVGEIGTFVLKRAVKQVRGGKVYEINERIGAVEAVTSLELVEAESIVAGRPYIFIASADKLEGILDGEEVTEAGDFNGLIGKFDYFDIPSCHTAGNYNFMIYQNLAQLCGDACYIYGGMAYIDMNNVPQQGQGPAAPGRARFIMGGKGATTGLLEGNVIVPAQGVEKMMVGGQLIIVRDGKMFNAQGAQL